MFHCFSISVRPFFFYSFSQWPLHVFNTNIPERGRAYRSRSVLGRSSIAHRLGEKIPNRNFRGAHGEEAKKRRGMFAHSRRVGSRSFGFCWPPTSATVIVFSLTGGLWIHREIWPLIISTDRRFGRRCVQPTFFDSRFC